MRSSVIDGYSETIRSAVLGTVTSRSQLVTVIFSDDDAAESAVEFPHAVSTAVAVTAEHNSAAVRIEDFKRSEEHTSELQSLMRISYAVFCMNKKTTATTHKQT